VDLDGCFDAMTISQSVIRRNAGAISFVDLCGGGSLSIARSRIEDGGVFLDGGARLLVSDSTLRRVGIESVFETELAIERSLLADSPGAAIYATYVSATSIRSSTISGSADGAVVVGNSRDCPRLVVEASTLARNHAVSAASAGGLTVAASRPDDCADVTLHGTLLAENTGPGAPDCADPTLASVVSAGYNLIGDAGGCAIEPGAGDLLGNATVPVDPRLEALADNGGPTSTLALGPGSPAVDAIPRAACLEPTDQRGVARPQGAACDIGAFETVPEPSAALLGAASLATLALLRRRRGRPAARGSARGARRGRGGRLGPRREGLAAARGEEARLEAQRERRHERQGGGAARRHHQRHVAAELAPQREVGRQQRGVARGDRRGDEEDRAA
jgi:hypothetical protein